MRLQIRVNWRDDRISRSVPECHSRLNAMHRLSYRVGTRRSRELVLLGKPITAARAAEWEIVNEALPQEPLDERVTEICALLQRRSSGSLSIGK
jgi:enoyl-CoA hydratase/carnithine racemase